MVRRYSKEAGFTLIELLIAMVIGVVVMGAIYSVYNLQNKTYKTQQQVVAIQQNVRAAILLLKNNIRMAGFDPTEDANTGFLEPFPSGHTSVGPTAQASVIAFSIDDNEDGSIDANAAELIAYRLNGGAIQLYRAGTGWQDLVTNVDALNFVYLDASSNVLATPVADPENIRAIQVSIVARADATARGFTDTTVYRNLQNSVILPAQNDSFRRRQLSTEIKCRNLGL